MSIQLVGGNAAIKDKTQFGDDDGGGNGGGLEQLQVIPAENGWIVKFTAWDYSVVDEDTGVAGVFMETTRVFEKHRDAVQEVIYLMGVSSSVKLK